MKPDLYEVLGAKMRVLKDEPMARHTTMKVGGPADYFAVAESEEQICFALKSAFEAEAPIMIIGSGSNLIVRDGGIRGVVLRTALSDMRFEGSEAAAAAGCSLSSFIMAALDSGLMGLEFAHGIPGSIGGALYMNAGAYGGEIGGRIKRIEGVTLKGEPFSLTRGEAGFGYRESIFQRGDKVVLRAVWGLMPDDGSARARIVEYAKRRQEKQPLNMPSAGSVFKRPEGYFAGALIEGAGLKGARFGGAMVSERHAGFIVNAGNARASDITGLIELVQKCVFERAGVMLQTEVKLVGEEEQ